MNITDFYSIMDTINRDSLTCIADDLTYQIDEESKEKFEKIQIIAERIGWSKGEVVNAIMSRL